MTVAEQNFYEQVPYLLNEINDKLGRIAAALEQIAKAGKEGETNGGNK